jgi:hypothetical protein
LIPIMTAKNIRSSLLELIVLEEINSQLELGLTLESTWKRELNPENVLTFLICCVTMFDYSIEVAQVGDRIRMAMQMIEQKKTPTQAGRSRLHNILQTVFESFTESDWVRALEAQIVDIVVSGPDESFVQKIGADSPSEHQRDPSEEARTLWF